jgi:hypothetical protein
VQGIVSTPGFCKFSAWKRESDLPRQPFSGWLLGCLAAHPPARTWIKDISTGRSIAFGEVRGHVDRIAKVSKKILLHCKKRLSIFTPNSPKTGINQLFPSRQSLVSDFPAGDGKIENIFYTVCIQALFCCKSTWVLCALLSNNPRGIFSFGCMI